MKRFLTLLAAGLISYSCGDITSRRPTTEERELGVSINLISLPRSLYGLVNHCHDFSFKQGDKGNNCGIIIPYTRETDDKLSGTGNDSVFLPERIPGTEAYLVIQHSPKRSPIILINGADISGERSGCEEFYCLDSVVKQIKAIDRRNGNTAVEDLMGYYDREMKFRYQDGEKIRR